MSSNSIKKQPTSIRVESRKHFLPDSQHSLLALQELLHLAVLNPISSVSKWLLGRSETLRLWLERLPIREGPTLGPLEGSRPLFAILRCTFGLGVS